MHNQTPLSAPKLLFAGAICCSIWGSLLNAAGNERYEDDRLRVLLPAGWVAKQVSVTATGDRTFQIHMGGLLSKDKYRIYLLSHDGQASGIIGGRFGEISKYVSPWMETGDCIDNFEKVVTPVSPHISRVDLFLDPDLTNKRQDSDCRNLHQPTKSRIWFGSYFGKANPALGYPGFFLTFPPARSEMGSPDDEMVFTATMDTKDPGTLPVKGDKELGEFLREASNIVSSVQYK